MRWFFVVAMVISLGACSSTNDLMGDVDPIGDFEFGFVKSRVPDDVTKGPLSRTASADELNTAMEAAFQRRFARFSGDEVYHIGLAVDGYVIAQPGIPIVMSPKSVMIFRVIVIENDTQLVLNEKPEQITVIETLDGGNLIGSGLTSTKEEQLEDLANAAAKATEKWMRQQPWFFDGQTGVVTPDPKKSGT